MPAEKIKENLVRRGIMIFRYFGTERHCAQRAGTELHLYLAYLRYGGLFNSGMVGLQRFPHCTNIKALRCTCYLLRLNAWFRSWHSLDIPEIKVVVMFEDLKNKSIVASLSRPYRKKK